MALISVLGPVFNGWSRIFLAWTTDYFNYKTTYIIITGVNITALVLMVTVNNIVI
jgi:hypothetical protein